jgi:hypothetical protein
LTDRHYALFANNQHPIQVNFYSEWNKLLANLHNPAKTQQALVNGTEYVNTALEKSKKLNQAEGESLSIDELEDIYIQVQGRARERNNLSLSTRTKTGDINDYLETRRPFGANQ